MAEMKKLCRCRWCDRNDIDPASMGIMSFKASYGGFTGVCKACFAKGDSAQAAYSLRVEELMKSRNVYGNDA